MNEIKGDVRGRVNTNKKKPPPLEEEWKKLGLEERCSCNEYDWKTTCPWDETIRGEIVECTCCPHCEYMCILEI